MRGATTAKRYASDMKVEEALKLMLQDEGTPPPGTEVNVYLHGEGRAACILRFLDISIR